ncbi:MAG: HAD hydrolase family protein [Promethearchaeia archaeon]
MSKQNVCAWDLEGPISVLDFAAELGRMLSKKSELGLQNYDMGEFFIMISNYDDYLIDTPGIKEKLGIPEYQPGDTLRLMAPFYAACFSDNELLELAEKNLGLLPGCETLMKILQKEWDVYVISTSYTHFAHTVTHYLGIPKENVYCTDLNINELKKKAKNIKLYADILVKEIFQKYLDNDKSLDVVLDDLNNFFWKNSNSDYITIMNHIQVRGGKRKELAIEDISKRTGVPISEMIAIGDSITDINMLQRLKDEGGIAVSFNGNRFTIKRATVAITTPNNLGILPIFYSKVNIEDFLSRWEKNYEHFKDNPKKIVDGLIPNEIKEFFIKFNFVPEIYNLTNKTQKELKEITEKQEKMRKIVRGWAGNLG